MLALVLCCRALPWYHYILACYCNVVNFRNAYHLFDNRSACRFDIVCHVCCNARDICTFRDVDAACADFCHVCKSGKLLWRPTLLASNVWRVGQLARGRHSMSNPANFSRISSNRTRHDYRRSKSKSESKSKSCHKRARKRNRTPKRKRSRQRQRQRKRCSQSSSGSGSESGSGSTSKSNTESQSQRKKSNSVSASASNRGIRVATAR